ncbi:MAG: PIN domain-containing protein, partial [Planctomycetota bacterium]
MTDRPQATTNSNPTQTAESAKRVKHFVLDTNVLLHNPNAIFVFEENHVIIPYPVIEELDTMKRREDDIGRNARQCIRHLDRLRELGKLTEQVSWGDMEPTAEFNPTALAADGKAGTIRIDVTDHARPTAISKDMPDNRIIAVAYALKLE